MSERYHHVDVDGDRVTLDDPAGAAVALLLYVEAGSGAARRDELHPKAGLDADGQDASVLLDAGAVVALRDACDEWLAERVPWWLTSTEAPS